MQTVFDAKIGEWLGAHMIGAEVTELIEGHTAAKQLVTTEAKRIDTVFPDPMLSGTLTRRGWLTMVAFSTPSVDHDPAIRWGMAPSGSVSIHRVRCSNRPRHSQPL